MAGPNTTKAAGGRRPKSEDEILYDCELDQFPPELRWREWMLLIDDLREELCDRPYELVPVAGGWQHRTRSRYAGAIQASAAPTRGAATMLSEFEAMVLMAVGYFQPVARSELSKVFGKEVSRDTIGALRGAGFIASGPRSPTPGAPYNLHQPNTSSPRSACSRYETYRTSRRLKKRGC